ncbi:polysaccharide biosynthesis protein [Actinobacillus indolicus]|nr:polysaccharide biosynthesis protein [Actinobacillus indolicus]VTU07112.1 polysaccharide biosynthesis protein [Actinobacillus indolicus]
MNNSNVIKNIVALTFLQLSNYIVPLMAWPLLARTLGIEQFGLLMMLFAICSMANVFTDFGFNLSATHKIAQFTNDKEYVGQLLGNIFFIKVIFAIIASIITYIYIDLSLFSQEDTLLDYISILLIMFIIFSQSIHCIWFFQGIEKMKYITKINIIAKLGYVFLLFFSFLFFQSINIALFCFFITQLFISFLFIRCIYKEKFYILPPKMNMIYKELQHSFSFFTSRVAVSIYTLCNTLILGYFSGVTMVGLYSSAEKVYQAGNGLVGVVSQALFPYSVRTKNIQLLFKISSVMFFIVSISSYIISFFSADIMGILFGDNFRDSGRLLNIFLVILTFSSISMIMGYPMFSALNSVKWANYTVIFGAVFHLIGIVCLVTMKVITIENVLFLTLITEVLVFVLRISCACFLYRRNNKCLKLT